MATEAGALLSDFDLPFPPGARVLFTSGPHRGLEATALRTRPATERKPECLLVRLDGSQAATLCLDVGNDSGAVRRPPLTLRQVLAAPSTAPRRAAAAGPATGVRRHRLLVDPTCEGERDWCRGLRLPDYVLDTPGVAAAHSTPAAPRGSTSQGEGQSEGGRRSPVLPTLFLPGFPKSATTWLYNCFLDAFAPRRAGCGADASGWGVHRCNRTFLLPPLTAASHTRREVELEAWGDSGDVCPIV